MQHRTEPSRVAEWADLVGETVPTAVETDDTATDDSRRQ
jgi:hypothetical protein